MNNTPSRRCLLSNASVRHHDAGGAGLNMPGPSLARLLTAVLVLISGAEAKGVNKIAPDVDRSANYGDYIVRFVTNHSSGLADVRGYKSRFRLKRELGRAGSVVLHLSARDVEALSHDPNVDYISPDRAVQTWGDEPVLDYTFEATFADIAKSYGYTGKNIGVAVVDSGIFVHDDLRSAGKSAVAYSENFVIDELSTQDLYGHGTHVAGVLAGNGAMSSGDPRYLYTFRGIAPGVRIVSLRVLDRNGRGTDSAVIAAIDRAIDLKDSYNIRVLNLSLGRPVFETFVNDPLCQAVERAWKAGIVVVVAAGNGGRENGSGTHGYGSIASPANHPLAITVGAARTVGSSLRSDDVVASYSSKGPSAIDHVAKPDIVAPGNRVIAGINSNSLIYQTESLNRIPYSLYDSALPGMSDIYYRMSGTSMAAPVVSGAAALLLEQSPALQPDAVKARLMRSASKSFPSYGSAYDEVNHQTYVTQHDVFAVGAGYLDIWAALNETRGQSLSFGQAASPVAIYDSATNKVTLAEGAWPWGSPAVWGSQPEWGCVAVWGPSAWTAGNTAEWGSSELWGMHEVWGDQTVAGFSALWNAVWGSSTPITGSTALLVNGER